MADQQTPRGWFVDLRGMRIGRRWRHTLTPQQRQQVEATLYGRADLAGPDARNFLVLSVLSSAIAALGLLLDSVPAVIGAMLLGPFITPLLATAAAVVQGRAGRLWRATLMTVVGVAASVGAGALIGWIVGTRLRTDDLTGQLLALTRPGLLDLGIAFAAGVAAGFTTLRTEAGSALSGVAVSVTIQPPLAATGLFLAAGNNDALRRAALAMVTNFGALVVGATVALAWWGLAERTPRSQAKVRWTVLVWLVAIAATAVPLAAYSRQVVEDTRFEEQVSDVVQQWDPSVRIVSLDAQLRGDHATVKLSISGPRQPEPARRLAELLSNRRGVRVTVEVTFTLTSEDTAVATP